MADKEETGKSSEPATEEPESGGGPEEKTAGEGGEARRATSSRLWTPDGEKRAAEEPPRSPGPAQEEISDEELQRRIEEAMEKITVADVIVDMMVSLSSLAYQRMGLPKEVNEKFRDMEQARLAIDCIESMLKAISARLPDEHAKALTDTLDNLKLNFAKES